MLEEVNRVNLLFDIYGPLLTEKQRRVVELYFSDNYSLGEIAEAAGVSRQAVHDTVRRALHLLEGYESKLSLFHLFSEQQALLEEAEALLAPGAGDPVSLNRLREIIAALRLQAEQ